MKIRGGGGVILGSLSGQVKSLTATLPFPLPRFWGANDWRRLNILLCNLPILKHEITAYSVVSLSFF